MRKIEYWIDSCNECCFREDHGGTGTCHFDNNNNIIPYNEDANYFPDFCPLETESTK